MNDNKLIAHFMGAKVVQSKDSLAKRWVCEDYNLLHNKLYLTNQLKYNTSWDWLMPVIKKIEELFGEEYQVITINGCSCKIETPYNYIEFEELTKLEAVYKTVVEFIKWYNKSKDEIQIN